MMFIRNGSKHPVVLADVLYNMDLVGFGAQGHHFMKLQAYGTAYLYTPGIIL
jgi:hypothetical protein